MTDKSKESWLKQPTLWLKHYGIESEFNGKSVLVYGHPLDYANSLTEKKIGDLWIDDEDGVIVFTALVSDTFQWGTADSEYLDAEETVHLAACLRIAETLEMDIHHAATAYVFIRREYAELPPDYMKPERWSGLVEPMREIMAFATETISGTEPGETKQ
jgi:hypothetical protein